VIENERLQGSLQGTERDTIEVIAYLKNEIKKQRKEVEDADERCKVLRRECSEEIATTEAKLQRACREKEEQLEEEKLKTEELRTELSRLKEFSKLRVQIEKELANVKAANVEIQQQYAVELESRETKFYEEKVRMRVEAEAEIAALAERAHASAVAGLDETTRNTYKENVRLEEELQVNRTECARLNEQNGVLEEELLDLRSTSEEASRTMTERVAAGIKTERVNRELRDKVAGLEKALGHCVREFEHEKSLMAAREVEASETDRMEIKGLRKTLELKVAETRRVRHLARNILVQRSEIEGFFLDSLHQVKKEITHNRANFERDSKEAFNRQVAAAAAGKDILPPIQTFAKSATSTNSLHQSFDAAGDLPEEWADLDPRDLTWEQRERVLRYLFKRMTQSKAPKEPEPITEPLLGDATGKTVIGPLPIDLGEFTMNPPLQPPEAITTGVFGGATQSLAITGTATGGGGGGDEAGSFFLTDQAMPVEA
jgi:hypothetical protein